MENDKTLDPNESLELISQTIQNTKEGLKSNSFYFILWGLLVSIACIIHYYLLQSDVSEYPYIAWPILMVAGAIISAVHGYKQTKNNGYESYTDFFMKNLWIGLGIGFFIAVFLCIRLGVQPTGFILLLSGAGTLITGMNVKFLPLILGGVVLFIAALISVFLNGSEALLLCAGALVLGYIIPGLFLKYSN